MTSNERAARASAELLATRTDEKPSAQTTFSDESLTKQHGRFSKRLLIALASSIFIVAGVAFILSKTIFQTRIASSPLASFQTMRISRLTSVGKVTDTAVSPDGKYVVYVLDDDGRQSLWLRHVPTNSDKEIVAPQSLRYQGLSFSHDGNYIYFIGAGKDKGTDGLYKVTVLGGDLRKLSGGIGSSASELTTVRNIALAPDDQHIAFARKPDGRSESALIVMNLDGTNERKLATRQLPERFGDPVWSPDGKTLFYSVANISAGYSFTLFEARVEDGVERQISAQKWWSSGRPVWLRDGSGVLLSASDSPGGASQIWYVSYPAGAATRITNDLNRYDQVSLTTDERVLVAIESSRQLSVSIAPDGDAAHARQIMSGDNSAGSVSWMPDNRIMYSSMSGGKRAVWSMDADGKNRKQLNADAENISVPVASPDGRYIVFQAYRAGVTKVWRMDADGGNLKQLTDDNGNFPVITPDSKWVVYYNLTTNGGRIWKVSIDGGAPVPLTNERDTALGPVVSPDGKMIACRYASAAQSNAPVIVFRLVLIPFDGGEPFKTFDNPGEQEINGIAWTPDSRALTYVMTRDGISNLWSQPIDGGSPKQLTSFTSDQIFSYDWSRDGTQLLTLHGSVSKDVVMLNGFK